MLKKKIQKTLFCITNLAIEVVIAIVKIHHLFCPEVLYEKDVLKNCSNCSK